MPHTIATLFAEGFEEIEAVTIVDILRRGGLAVMTVGLVKQVVPGAHGLVVKADKCLSDLYAQPDAIVLPGGMPGSANLGASAAAKKLVQDVASRGGTVAAICAAPVRTLSAWGMLGGKRATCYPGLEGEFAPDVVFTPENVVVDGNVVTSRGIGTALAFSLRLVELFAGRERAEVVARSILA